MTENNTRLWDELGRTDPSQTKGFKRAGGFTGTAIKPMWSFRRMTEQFGPCGLGWGVNEPSFQVVPGCDGEVLVYCTVSVWYTEGESKPVGETFGVGGDKVVVKQTSGLRSDDEAFKKAYTDAIGNALKLIGVGADVHMGLFDDSKYVNEMRQEFSEDTPKKPDAPAPKPLTVAERKALWSVMMDDLKAEAPKGWRKMAAYITDAETQRMIETLGSYKQQFLDEARDIVKIAQDAEKELGEPVGGLKATAYNFDRLENGSTVGDMLDATENAE